MADPVEYFDHKKGDKFEMTIPLQTRQLPSTTHQPMDVSLYDFRWLWEPSAGSLVVISETETRPATQQEIDAAALAIGMSDTDKSARGWIHSFIPATDAARSYATVPECLLRLQSVRKSKASDKLHRALVKVKSS